MSNINNPHAAPEPDTLSALKDLEQALLPSGLHPVFRRDPVTAMLQRKDFLLRLEQEISRAFAPRRPLALVLFEISGMGGLEKNESETLLRTLSSRLWESAQREDKLGRLEDGLLAFVLPGSGHFQALALAESVVNDVWLQYAALGFKPFPLRASVASPERKDHALFSLVDDVMEKALWTLRQASASPDAQVQERVKLYRRDEAPEERETLVLVNEKQFLFFGGV